ncbi:glycosyltransferase family 2 protein [Haploplasma modicum]|uniref:glycosyltransferase family 2 protein n=1 Tax=Haploplasma modicum TaxID=2150 RepID=UPI00138B0F39|nr:glycosyltransferase family 2 protein [Haploplasma modicum]
MTILLSTYNGEKFLKKQLESLYDQTYKNIKIYIRDDGSTDNTLKILDEEQKKGKILFYSGKNKGVAESFWELIKNASDSDYYAFCDQDDFWLKDKIEKSVKRLVKEDKNMPLLYMSNVKIVDSNLNVIKDDKKDYEYIENPKRALIKSLSPGCTFVFNYKSILLLRKYNGKVDIHDWMTHKIISLHGKVIKDYDSTMLYRQHENNVIGAKNGIIKTMKRVIKTFKNSDNSRKKIGISLLENYSETVSNENREYLELLANYDQNKKSKKKFYKEFKTVLSPVEKIYFKFLISKGKI